MNNTKKFNDHWNREKQPPFELRMFQSTSRRNGFSTPRDISRRISDIIFSVYFCNVPEKRAEEIGEGKWESGDAGRLGLSRLGEFIDIAFPRFRCTTPVHCPYNLIPIIISKICDIERINRHWNVFIFGLPSYFD